MDWISGENKIMEPNNEDLARLKEVKVKIPVNFHIKLHSMKVLTGRQISDTITEALEKYFLDMRHAGTPEEATPELVAALRSEIEEP